MKDIIVIAALIAFVFAIKKMFKKFGIEVDIRKKREPGEEEESEEENEEDDSEEDKKKKKESEEKRKKKRLIKIYRTLWIILLIIVFLTISWNANKIFVVILSSSKKLKDLKEIFSITGAWLSWFVILSAWYILPFCFKVVKGQEHGVKTLFGIPYGYADSGLHFIWWPAEKIHIYTKIRQRINIHKQEVVTKSDESQIGTTNGNKLFALTPVIDATLYYSYPRDERLLEVYRSVSRDPEEVTKLFEDPIKDGVRVAAGEKNWQECTQQAFQEVILEKLKNKPIPEAQETFSYEVEITELKLPEGFKNSLSEKLASIAKSEGEKQGIILKGEGEAEARKIVFKAINDCDNWQLLEAFLSFREMAKGDNKWILGLPDSLQQVLGNVLGKKS